MNQRFRLLAEQVEWRFADRLTGELSEYDKRLLKFAELIVKECAKVVADAVDHREPASAYVGKIKEHFGQGKSQDHWQPDPDLA